MPRREYAQFKKEREQMKYATNQNQMYKSPISKFENPMFGKAANWVKNQPEPEPELSILYLWLSSVVPYVTSRLILL